MESQDFILNTEYIDLSQLLKATGLAMSGGEAKMFVTEGMVFVNDEIELAMSLSLIQRIKSA